MAKDYTNQHIVPKRYLDRFGMKDGKRTIIGTRIVNKGNVRFFTDSTVNVGYIKNYYDVTDKNDSKYWEHYFAREIDTLCGQDMENIIAKVTLSRPDTIVLSAHDKEVLSKLIIAQLMRIPESIDYVKTVLYPEQSAVPIPAEGKRLYITQDTKTIDFHALLGQIVQCVNMGEILAEIKAGTQYVVQIPAEFQAAYESGEMFIMENMKTGKKWPSLMKIAEDGKHQVVTPLPIAEQAIVQGNPVQELANSHHNMLMQQQVAQLTEMVERTYRVVEQIKHGQMDDRIGLLEAGKNGLILAMSMPEGEERNRQIDSSRQNLLVAQAQIEKTLERRAGEFEPLPKAAPVRFMREVIRSGYLAEKRRDVQEMQDYYDLYLQATKLLAASYALCGNLETAEQTFRLSESTIRSIDFSKVETIRYQHKGLTDMFYSAPAGYIATERTVCLEEAKHYDYVALEVSGEKLLEVLGNGQAEAVQEAGTEE